MTDLVTFGDPARFAITLGWADDPEPRDRRPAHGGWSTGQLGLTVGGYVLTRHARNNVEHDTISWYLLPVLTWLAENWVPLLHEERFAWHENSASPAATATFFKLRRWVAAEDSAGRSAYDACHVWWKRHALRAADSSALFPDLYCRRLGDDTELSWTGRPPTHAPDGFRFALEPGIALLAIHDVAGPLWEALNWFVSTADTVLPADRSSLIALEGQISELRDLPTASLEAGFLPRPILDRITAVREGSGLPSRSVRMDAVPAIEHLDQPVLMFGGVSPDIGSSDFETLIGFLARQSGRLESPALLELVDSRIGPPVAAPHEEGYDLAEDLLDELDLPGDHASIDIVALLNKLSVTIDDLNLHTDTIRGVAVAGPHYAPGILVNGKSHYNISESGRRFTLAHELFHLLYDRTRARAVAHTSGPWAPQGVEKRANAFAAMLLMPRALVRRSLPHGLRTDVDLRKAAAAMQVGQSALIEHLYNIGFIDTVTRDAWRLKAKRT